MPLKEKKIMVEGPDSETIIRTIYVEERETSRYGDRSDTLPEKRKRKVRELMARRVSKNEPGYTWSIGYNHCAGFYSGGRRRCAFTGSSLNRDKSIRYEKKENMEGGDGTAIALAYKAARPYYRDGVPLPEPLNAYLRRQDAETERGFRCWLSVQNGGPENGFSLPIYQLSARSRGKIKDKATAFFRACPGERVFCTLTFIAPVDDATGVALLNKFLTAIRKEHKNLQYLWVAERQQNGNVHFHLILNKRLSIRRYNALWVLQQYKSGLQGQTTFGVPISLREIEERYKKGTIHKLFNPMDVKKVRSIAGLSSYLTKYITKHGRNEDGSKRDVYFSCAPWHCSRGVSRLFTKATVSPSVFRYMMSLENCRVDKQTGEVFMPEMVRPKGAGAFCVVVYVNKKDAPLRYLREMEQINKWLIRGFAINKGHLDVLDDDRYREKICKN